jgi:hypothetical protein
LRALQAQLTELWQVMLIFTVGAVLFTKFLAVEVQQRKIKRN